MMDNIRSQVKVYYIMAVGRSGSTVLDMVLGSHPDVLSVGELANLVRTWTREEYCACGSKVSKCPFWSEVVHSWLRICRLPDLQAYDRLQDKFERIRQIPRLILLRRYPSRDFTRYIEATRALFSAICEVSGKSIIVDSSKNPARAYALSTITGLDLHLVHLVRDGRGVVWSHMKAYEKSVRQGIQREFRPVPSWKSSIDWAIVNLICEAIRFYARKTRPTQMRYEDFVQDTASLQLIDQRFESIIVNHGKTGDLPVQHVIAGNRSRMTGSLTIQGDYEWETKLPKHDEILFWLIAGSLAWKYGYRP